MRFLLILLAAASTAVAQTNDVQKIKVTGDRVSLRAKPSLDGELLDRAMRGDEMVWFEKTNGWVAVQAPDSLNFWVAQDYIEEGKVKPPKLNVRSGPSLNYNVIAVVTQGDAVEVRGDFPPAEESSEAVAGMSKWFKIAPPVGARVWISEDYVEEVLPPAPVPAVVETAPEPVVEKKPEPKPVVEKTPEPKSELPPLMLVLDDTKPQGKSDRIPGVLRRANPGLYKLVLISGEIEEPICLVRGRESQLEKMLNRSLLIEGKIYWAKDVNLPVLQPTKIHLDPIVSE
jgi:uncharacterized protein YraI